MNRSNKIVLLISKKGICKENEDVGSVGVKCPTNKNKFDDDNDNIYDDYILSDKKKFEFASKDEDEWIDVINSDYVMENTLDDVFDSKKEWKLGSEDDDIDIDLSDKSDSSKDKTSRDRKKNIDPTSKFKCKRFKVSVDGSINFKECKIFNNVHHFRDMLREYKVKHDYHLKITIS